MSFNQAKSARSSHEAMIKKFWGRISEMITGPDHEYTYLKKLIARLSALKEEIKRYNNMNKKRNKKRADFVPLKNPG